MVSKTTTKKALNYYYYNTVLRRRNNGGMERGNVGTPPPSGVNQCNKFRSGHCGFLVFEKIEWSADFDKVYLDKNDHR